MLLHGIRNVEDGGFADRGLGPQPPRQQANRELEAARRKVRRFSRDGIKALVLLAIDLLGELRPHESAANFASGRHLTWLAEATMPASETAPWVLPYHD